MRPAGRVTQLQHSGITRKAARIELMPLHVEHTDFFLAFKTGNHVERTAFQCHMLLRDKCARDDARNTFGRAHA